MKYSFIIPIYNSEKYLERCIESVLNQNLSSSLFEIILINDGSVDSSKKICNFYVNQYQNIRYFEQDNCGVSKSRNVGIRKCKGEYIVFVDSDDTLIKDSFQKIHLYLENQNIDLLKCSVKCIENKQYDYRFDLPLFKKNSGLEALLKFIKSEKIFATPWAYIIKRSLIEDFNLYFIEDKFHEDYGLMPLLIFNSSTVSSIDIPFYNYIKRKNSLVTDNSFTIEYQRAIDFIYHTRQLKFYFFSKIKSVEQRNLICQYFTNRLNIKFSHLSIELQEKLRKEVKKVNEEY